MSVEAIAINCLKQIDNHHFEIEWSDGKKQKFQLAELQKVCSCARCVDEGTGSRLVDPATISSNLSARSVKSVGRYALRIDFTSGCSLGIFTFDKLRQMAKD